jgi:glyoxylase-like metal-dependent hydrolase (beta-lactamase superfamily II)
VATKNGREVAPGIYRLGSYWVNWFLVDDGGRYTVVDSGLPAYFDELVSTIASLGGSPENIEALVLTHYHSDHTGCAERIRTEFGATVLVPEREKGLALGVEKGGKLGGLLGNVWRPHMLRFTWHLKKTGGLKAPPTIGAISTFRDGEVLDVPGKPQVVATPGHSPGHVVFVFQDRDAVMVGDAMGTLNVATGASGPTIFPLNENRDMAVASLARLEPLTVTTLLPGHGDPWKGEMAEAVRIAREANA